jgi:hypothetical protein
MFLLIQKWRRNKTGLSYVGFAIPLLAKSYYVSLTLNKSCSEVSGKYIGCNFLFTSLTRPTWIGFCLRRKFQKLDEGNRIQTVISSFHHIQPKIVPTFSPKKTKKQTKTQPTLSTSLPHPYKPNRHHPYCRTRHHDDPKNNS